MRHLTELGHPTDLIAHRRIALALALMLVLGLGLSAWSSAALAAPAPASAQTATLAQGDGEGGFELILGAATCEVVPPLPPTLDEAGCVAAVGVGMSVFVDGGGLLGTCTTSEVVPSGQLAQCTVIVPYEISGQVYEDESTVPAGYAPQGNPLNFSSPPPGPPDGIVSRPIFVNLPVGNPALVQELDGSITATVYNCPPGMTAETLAPESCSPVSTGFDLLIVSYEGIFEPLTLAAAAAEGGAYTWSGLDAGPGGTDWGIREDILPAGYTSYIAAGDAVSAPPAPNSAWMVTLSEAAPAATVAIYNFAPAGSGEETPVDPPATDADSEGATRLATVTTGTCADLGGPAAEPVAVNAPQGDPIGLETALIAETGGGVITIALDDLFAAPHAIVVITPGESEATTVACGDLGAVADDDGVAVIGLQEVDGSGLAGIAYLSTDAANPAQTLVSIFLADGLTEDED